MTIRAMAAVSGLVALASGASSAQFLLVPDSTNDVVGLYSAFDGSLINANFIDLAAAPTGSQTPIQALQVGNQIWVSDQLGDRINRFDSAGNFIGTVGENIVNNVRGMEVVGNTVYAATGSNGSLGEGIYTFDATTGASTGFFNGRDPVDTNYFDVIHYNGELLITNIDTGNDGIERYDLAGNFLGVFFASDGASSVDFPQQMTVNSAGNLLVGGFSPPSGVYEIAAAGTDLGIVAGLDLGPRGAIELGNGEIAYTNGSFFQTDSQVLASNGSFRFISTTSIPAPAGLFVLAGLAGVARRR